MAAAVQVGRAAPDFTLVAVTQGATALPAAR